MIDAKELMIGSYVKDGSRIGKVTMISKSRIKVKLEHSLVVIDTQLDCKMLDVQPIPITEDWLLRFGFEKESDLSFSIINKLQIDLISNKFSFYMKWGNIMRQISTIKHIHQLQNLYFALTGEELSYRI